MPPRLPLPSLVDPSKPKEVDPLVSAVQNDDIPALTRLLKGWPVSKSSSFLGWRTVADRRVSAALQNAVSLGRVESVRRLLPVAPPPLPTDNPSWLALAVRHRHPDVLALLLPRYRHAFPLKKKVHEAFQEAVDQRDATTVIVFLEKGVRPNWSETMGRIAEKDSLELARLLVPLAPQKANQRCLILAALQNRSTIVRHLLETGAVDPAGGQALVAALKAGASASAALLEPHTHSASAFRLLARGSHWELADGFSSRLPEACLPEARRLSARGIESMPVLRARLESRSLLAHLPAPAPPRRLRL